MQRLVKSMSKSEHECRSAVCVHGAGGGGWEWTIWQRVFAADGWQTLAPDLHPCGAGLSATRFEDYAAQVQLWTENISSSAPVLIGASLGGLLALQIATRVPIAALVLVNPLPPVPLQLRLQKSDYPPIVTWGSQRSLSSTRRALADADDAACLHAFRRWRDESGAALNQALSGIELTPPTCPILIVASELDTDVPLATSTALAQSLNADLIVVPQASHVGPLLGHTAAECAGRVLLWLHEHDRAHAQATRKAM